MAMATTLLKWKENINYYNMKYLDKFEEVTILQHERHLVLQLNGKTIKSQTNLIIENGTDPMCIITVTFRVPTGNVKVIQDDTLPEYYPV